MLSVHQARAVRPCRNYTSSTLPASRIGLKTPVLEFRLRHGANASNDNTQPEGSSRQSLPRRRRRRGPAAPRVPFQQPAHEGPGNNVPQSAPEAVHKSSSTSASSSTSSGGSSNLSRDANVSTTKQDNQDNVDDIRREYEQNKSNRSRSAGDKPSQQAKQPKTGLIEVSPPESWAYWDNILCQVNASKTLKDMADKMDEKHPVGMTLEWAKSEGGSVNCYNDYVRFKKEYPKHVILIKVGGFHQTCGIDALVLAQWLKNGIMNESSGVPTAGNRSNQLKSVVRKLNHHNFSVVIVDERDPDGKPSSKKERYLMGISTPAKPWYLGGDDLGQEKDMDNEEFVNQKPMMGVAWSREGYQLYVLELELGTVELTHGLTWDGLFAMLSARGVAPPLLLHDSLKHAVDHDARKKLRDYACAEIGDYVYYSEPDSERGFISQVKRLIDYPAHYQFQVVRSKDVEGRERARPLPRSTVLQLGLQDRKSTGACNLLSLVVPRETGTPPLCRRFLEQLLLLPPPPAIALHIAAAVKHLSTTSSRLFTLNAGLPSSQVAEALESLRGDASFFRELHGLLHQVVTELHNNAHTEMWDQILPVALWANKRMDDIGQVQLNILSQQLAEAEALIEHHVVLEQPDLQDRQMSGIEEDEDEDGSTTKKGVDLDAWFKQQEMFRFQVKLPHLQQQAAAVDAARKQVLTKLDKTIKAVVQRANQLEPDAEGGAGAKKRSMSKPSKSKLPEIKTSDTWLGINVPPAYKGAWMDLYKNCTVKRVESSKSSKKSDKDIEECLLTADLESYLEVYFERCQEAKAQAEEVLKELCRQLREQQAVLLLACRLAVIKEALEAHARAAREKDWVSATMVGPQHLKPAPNPYQQTAPNSPVSGASAGDCTDKGLAHLKVKGFWPYWTTWTDASTVRNDITLDRMVLLTGPNMAGKSTVMRSVCAIALLANCGLMVPAESARVPFYDSFLLRNFSGDSPVEGKSSYALEMQEVVTADQQSTNRSLVLLDELGKGTEVLHGSALAGALLKDWARQGFTGIFASHLHLLKPITQDAQLEEQGLLGYMCMGTRTNKQGKLEATWKLHDGVNFESLAFEVAEECGLRNPLLSEARTIMTRIERGDFAGFMPLPATSSSSPAASSEEGFGDGLGEGEGESEEVSSDVDLGTTTSTAGETGSGLAPPQLTLDDAQSILEECVKQGLGMTEEQWLQHLSAANEEEPQLQRLPPGYKPPVKDSGAAALYVIQWQNRSFYCGETSDVFARLMEHSRKHKYGGVDSMVYITLPQGSPDRRELERTLTRAMQQRGFPLSSTHDAGTKRFVKRASVKPDDSK